MSRCVIIALLAALAVACGGSPASPIPAESSSSVPTASTSVVASASSVASSPSLASAPAGSNGTGVFTICPTDASGSTCPLQAGSYEAEVHDRFGLSIPDAGWQEERASADEFETRIVLSRVDDASQRLTFLSGTTGPMTPAAIDPGSFAIPGYKASGPVAITIGGTDAVSLVLRPDGATSGAAVTIEGRSIPIEPDRRYRFTVARIPMGEEAATLIMVTEAPAAAFDAFAPLAEGVLESIRFP